MTAAPEQPPSMPTQQPEPKNGFGITSLVLALVGLVFTLMPITGFIALILGGLAIVFAILGMARVRRHRATNRKMNFFGIGIGAVALAGGIAGMVSFFNSVNDLDAHLRTLGGNSGAPPAVVAPALAPPQVVAPTPAPTGCVGHYQTSKSSVSICYGPGGQLYYTGVDDTSGNSITLPAAATANGYQTVYNNGYRYTVNSNHLVIDSNGTTVSDQSVITPGGSTQPSPDVPETSTSPPQTYNAPDVNVPNPNLPGHGPHLHIRLR